ncbi:MAG: hypothetical protein H6837_09570 [Planctomycetes bacterium]|nr:hypothetical protein [Planctomycetota bacterium]
MWKELFQSSQLLDIPIGVMLFFLAIFALVLLRACSRKRANHYTTMAQLPLLDDETTTRSTETRP